METTVSERRPRGRPQRPVPDWLMTALATATETHRATLDRAKAGIGAAELHELRLTLRAAATRLGRRPRVHVTATHVQFWSAGDGEDTAA